MKVHFRKYDFVGEEYYDSHGKGRFGIILSYDSDFLLLRRPSQMFSSKIKVMKNKSFYRIEKRRSRIRCLRARTSYLPYMLLLENALLAIKR